MSFFHCLCLFHWPGRTCTFTSSEFMDLSIMAFRGAPCIYTRASLAVALTLWCLYSTITLHCTWLHLQPAYIHLFFTCSLTTAVVRTRTSTCWPTATGYNKVFQSITISFLPVGHTHEDIDQMFSTFVIGMKYNPQVLTVEAFIQGLQDWYSAPHLRPEPIFLLECWSVKSWMDPYIQGVQGTSRPHVFHFTHNEADVLMYTKDYSSSASPWMGPYSFLNICPTDSPIPLVPAQLDTTILKDTMSALTELNNADALRKSFHDLITRFDRPPLGWSLNVNHWIALSMPPSI